MSFYFTLQVINKFSRSLILSNIVYHTTS